MIEFLFFGGVGWLEGRPPQNMGVMTVVLQVMFLYMWHTFGVKMIKIKFSL